MPPAPLMFSTMTGWPSCTRNPSAMMRPITSDDPPRPNGTTRVSGRAGQSCARAEGAVMALAKTPPRLADATQNAKKMRDGLIDTTLFLRLIEIFQIRWRLILLDRHDRAVAAEVVDLLADGDPGLTFDAVVLSPPDPLCATVVLHHGPGPRQRIVGCGHHIVENAWLVRVNEQALLDDALVVVSHRHAALVPGARIAHMPGFDQQLVETAVAVLIDPFAE